jgi:hypothetical protein
MEASKRQQGRVKVTLFPEVMILDSKESRVKAKAIRINLHKVCVIALDNTQVNLKIVK